MGDKKKKIIQVVFLCLLLILITCLAEAADNKGITCDFKPEEIYFIKYNAESGKTTLVLLNGNHHYLCDKDNPQCSEIQRLILNGALGSRGVSLRYKEETAYKCDKSWGGGEPNTPNVWFVYLYSQAMQEPPKPSNADSIP